MSDQLLTFAALNSRRQMCETRECGSLRKVDSEKTNVFKIMGGRNVGLNFMLLGKKGK